MKENRAYWKTRAQYYERLYDSAQERIRLLIDQNRILSEKEKELRTEFEAKRTFMDKVESAYSEYQIAFAALDAPTDEHDGDWHGQIGGGEE